MKAIYLRPVNCNPCVDMDWVDANSCSECERLRREEVDILQFSYSFFGGSKAIIKRQDGSLATVPISDLTVVE